MTKETSVNLGAIYSKEDIREFLLNTHGAEVCDIGGLLRVVNSLARGLYDRSGELPPSKRAQTVGTKKVFARSEIANLLHDPAEYAFKETHGNDVDQFLSILKKTVGVLPNVGPNAYKAYLTYVKGQCFEYRDLRIARAKHELITLTQEVHSQFVRGVIAASVSVLDTFDGF